MDPKLRLRLIEALMSIPATQTFEGRTALLGVFPSAGLNRSATIRRTDLELLVDQLHGLPLATGESSLVMLVNNALPHVAGLLLEKELGALRDQLQAPHAGKVTGSFQLPRACNFDLHGLVETCLEKLPPEPGLVGLGVSCPARGFLENLCERLKDDLGRGKVNRRPLLALQPYVVSVGTAVEKVARCESLLRHGDVLYPVQLDMADEDSARDICRRFWKGLKDRFPGRLPNRLMVIMAGDPPRLFPRDIIQLGRPKFTKAHVHLFVRAVVSSLRWPDDLADEWKAFMISQCLEGEYLHIVLVYEHLEEVLPLVSGGVSHDEFRAELRKRRE